MSKWICLLIALSASEASAQVLSADEVMRRVAENQDRGQKLRSEYVYEENIRVATRYSNGKVAREEWAEYLVTPTPTVTEKKQQGIHGRYWEKGKYREFTGEPENSDGLDAGLTASFRNHVTRENSKDGFGKNMFPLTTDEQKDLKFEHVGEEVVAGRKAYRIRFAPNEKDKFAWAGEALIDAEEFQPVSVYTKLSRKLPLFVRAMLGTDVPGLGFTTRYTRVAKDVWFPSAFGTEFKLHAVFFINRTISVSMESRNFKRASSDSQIRYEGEPQN